MDYVIYTDGAYSKSKDLGAFVFIIVDENENEVCRMGHVTPSETNNRQELKAIIAAVSKLPDDARKVRIISDSMYALNTLSGECIRRANHDLFKLWEKTKRKKAVVELEFLWVKGHSGDYYNELCDELCNELIWHDINIEYAKYNRVN